MMKKLRRAKEGKKIAGVCKGIADFFQVDVSYVRLAWVFLAALPYVTLFGMVILYVILAVVLPQDEDFIDV